MYVHVRSDVIFPEQALPVSLTGWYGWQTMNIKDPNVSVSPVLGLQTHTPASVFVIAAGFNFGILYSYAASTLRLVQY